MLALALDGALGAWDFFAALDDLVMTGPTGTNANDVRIVLTGGT